MAIGAYAPSHCEFARYFVGDTHDARVHEESARIGHGGLGTICVARENQDCDL